MNQPAATGPAHAFFPGTIGGRAQAETGIRAELPEISRES